MNWTDLVVLILIGGIVCAEIKRGFGMALLTAIGAVLAGKLARLWAGPLSQGLRVSADAGHNQAIVLLALFAVMMAAIVGLTYVLHPDTWLSLDPFDSLFGGAAGIVTGWVVAAVFYTAVGAWGAADLVRTSAFAPEILELRTYHNIVGGLHRLGEVQEQKLNIGKE